jgi:hypothetical protein
VTWPAFLASVRVGGALPVWFELLDPNDFDLPGPDDYGGDRARITMGVPDRDTDLPSAVTRTLPLPPWTTSQDAAVWVRDQVRWFYRHEADEQIYVGGERVFDPREEHA